MLKKPNVAMRPPAAIAEMTPEEIGLVAGGSSLNGTFVLTMAIGLAIAKLL